MSTTLMDQQALSGATALADRPGTLAHRPGIREARRGQQGPQQMCCACGAITALYGEVRYARQGDARFCPTCWRDLAPEMIERLVREVALRGVPLS